MDLARYEELTGITVAAGDVTKVTAQIARTQSNLETMLGFTLDPDLADENLYIELGKTPLECSCSSVDVEDLNPADAVVTAYRLYDYNEKNKYLHVDPFTEVHAIKLVKDGVTVKTFDADEFRVDFGRDGWAKFIEVCDTCFADCNLANCRDCIQLAVDAAWMWREGETIPNDLLYVWADMITYYFDCKKDVKSETIGPHSYTKFDRGTPELLRENLAVIQRYAGPHGSVTRRVTI